MWNCKVRTAQRSILAEYEANWTQFRTQEAYEKAVTAVFHSLDRVESILQKSAGPYLLGSLLTEVDVRLYPTIVRFDVVYVTVNFTVSSFPSLELLVTSFAINNCSRPTLRRSGMATQIFIVGCNTYIGTSPASRRQRNLNISKSTTSPVSLHWIQRSDYLPITC